MESLNNFLLPLLRSSPTILALMIALAAVGVAGFALYVVLRATARGDK